MEEGTSLPIVTLLHGVYGSHWAWALKGEAHLTARALMTQKLIPPMVLLMPSDGLWGDGSGYIPHADADYEQWIVEEVPTIAYQLAKTCSPASPRYLAGLSMGGFGTWDLIARLPNKFAAAAPICGGADTTTAKVIAHIPIWVFHGADDKIVKVERSRDIVNALLTVGSKLKYSEYKDVGHDSWKPAYREPDFLKWMFGQRKG